MRSKYKLCCLLLVLLSACGRTPAATPEVLAAPTVVSLAPSVPLTTAPAPAATVSPTAVSPIVAPTALPTLFTIVAPTAPQTAPPTTVPPTEAPSPVPTVAATATLPPEPTIAPTVMPTPSPIVSTPVPPAPEQIAVVRDGAILTVSPDGTGERELVNGENTAPAWSPSGDLAYIRLRGSSEGGALFVRTSDGRTTRLAASGVTQLAWSPDGSRIAYTRTSDRDGDGVLRPDADRSQVRLITPSGAGDTQLAPGFDPFWTPDGEQVLVASPGRVVNGAPEGNELRLYSVEGDGSEVVVRTRDVPDDLRQYGSPFLATTRLLRYGAVSPDGRTVAFSALGGVGVLGTVESGGEVQVQDVLPESGFGPVVWAPGGNRIAYEIPAPSGANVVTVLDTATGNRVSFGNPREPDAGYVDPAWSPDSEALALVRTGPNGPQALVIAAPDAENERQIAAGAVSAPAWSAGVRPDR